MSEPGGGAYGPGVGSLADEASALFAAVQDWARRSATAPAHQLGGEGPECQLCPICQLLRVIRATRPEAFEYLADAAASLAAAVRELIAAHERSWAARSGSDVEHIDIG